MNQFAITISKYCRGSLTEQEIKDVEQFFRNRFIISRLLIINEHRNKFGEEFEHLHISLHTTSSFRTDNLNALIKKNLSFLVHKKDVLVKAEISDGWKEYCSKSQDRTVIAHDGITEQELEKYNMEYKIKVQTVKDSKQNVNKIRIPKADIPYVIINYIQDNELEYDFSVSMFTYIISKMLKENYDYELRNLVEVKAKTDNLLGDTSTLNEFIGDQFKFLNVKY